MNSKVTFCGECGKPLPEGVGFCGECGSPVMQPIGYDQSRPDSPQANPLSEEEKQTAIATDVADQSSHNDGFIFLKAFFSAFQWAVIWLIGWLPIGSLWHGWQYLYGITSFSIGTFIGGFLAGLMAYKTLGRKQLSIGLWGLIPVIAWAALWGIFWIFRFIPYQSTTNILAPIFAVLISQLAIEILHRKLDLSVTNQQRLRVALWWGISGLLASITATKLSYFLWEVERML